MALVGNYVENLTDPMVIVDEAYQFDGQIFLIIVGILRIFFPSASGEDQYGAPVGASN